MKSPSPQRVFYNGNKLSLLIQGKEHTAIMHGGKLPLAEKVLAGGDAIAHTRMLSTDRLGSTIVSSINAEQHELAFTPYGYIDPLLIKSLLGFTGQLRQAGTGCYLLGSRRAFNPITMRFNSYDDRSPFAEGNINGYAYCGCDPINYTDPSGRSRWGWFKKHILRTSNTKKYDVAFEHGRQQGYNEGSAAAISEYHKGFNAGRKTGYDEGLNAGRKTGYDEGFNAGRKTGYDEGLIKGHEIGKQDGMKFGSVWGFAEGKISGSKRLDRPLLTAAERFEQLPTLPLPLDSVTSKYYNGDQNKTLRTLADLLHQEGGMEPLYHGRTYKLDSNVDSQRYMISIRQGGILSRFNPSGR